MDVRRTLTSNPMQDGCAAHHDILETHEPSPVTSPSSCTVSAAALHWLLDGWPAAPRHHPFSSVHLTHNTTSGVLATLAQQHYIDVYLERIHNVSLRLQTLGLLPKRQHPVSSPKTTHPVSPKITRPIPPILGRPPALPPLPVDGHIGDWGVRAGAPESPGRPLGPGRPPSQPPPRAVPDEAAAWWSRTSPPPRLRQSPERHKEEEEARG